MQIHAELFVGICSVFMQCAFFMLACGLFAWATTKGLLLRMHE